MKLIDALWLVCAALSLLIQQSDMALHVLILASLCRIENHLSKIASASEPRIWSP